jgi:predicted PurR-regulated permease PerM
VSTDRIVRLVGVVWAAVGIVWLLDELFDVLSAVRLVLIPIVIALFPATMLAPVSGWLQRRGLPPAAAALLTIAAVLGVIVGGVTLIGYAAADQFQGFGAEVERGYEDVRRWLAQDSPITIRLDPWDEFSEAVRRWGWEGETAAVDPIESATIALGVLAGLVLAIVTSFFYIKDGDELFGWLVDLLPSRWAHHVSALGHEVWDALGAYVRSQFVVALIDAVLIGLGLVLLDVPLAIPLAVIVLIGGFIPFVGATVSGALAALVALADGGVGKALAVLAVVVVVQQVEGNVLEPLIVGRATHLHPLVVILAVAFGAAVLGVLGAFIAVPVVAAVDRTMRYVRGVRQQIVLVEPEA